MADLETILTVNRLVELDVIDKHGNFSKAWTNFLIEFFRNGRYSTIAANLQDNPLAIDDSTAQMLKIFAKDSLKPEDNVMELGDFMEKLRDSTSHDTQKALAKRAYMVGQDKGYVEELYRQADRTLRQL